MFIKNINKQLATSLEDAGFEQPTKIQKKTLSRLKGGTNILGVAPAGSGKSSAIAISVVHRLNYAKGDAPRAIIIVPNNEAIEAMEKHFEVIGANTDLRVFGARDQRDLLYQKETIYDGVDVVIAAPKRLSDLLSNTGINLNQLEMMMVDEGEEHMKTNSQGYIERIARSAPKCTKAVYSDVNTGRLAAMCNRMLEFYDTVDLSE